MRIRNARVEGNFQSIPDPRHPRDSGHRVTRYDGWLCWEWFDKAAGVWRSERVFIPAGERWDGNSRPWLVGWLVPRWGINSGPSLGHDKCFEWRPKLSNGQRISRKHTDLLFLHMMRAEARRRVDSGWEETAQLWLAEVMYRAVRSPVGEMVWDRHDEEFRA